MLVIAVGVSPFKLFKVSVKVLFAYLVEGSDDGALEQRPHSFDAVSVKVSNYPFLDGVPDRVKSSVPM